MSVMTWLKVINFFLMQWFFIRIGIGSKRENKGVYRWYFVAYFIFPLTGWWSDLIGVGGKFYSIDISKKKLIR